MSLCTFRAVIGTTLGVLLAVSAASGAEVIVDNTDPGFSVVSGTWNTGTSASGKYGTNYRYAITASTATAEAQWQPTIPTAGDYQVFVWYPSGSNRITSAQYKVYYNGGSQVVPVNQTANAGNWFLLGTFNFLAGSSTSGHVNLTNQSTQSSKRVYADAVRFFKPEPVTLAMASSPADAGATTPAVGGPYSYLQGDLVSITATANAGYKFDHWGTSAGSNAASPTSASTTVTMDTSKTMTAVFVPTVLMTMAVSPAGTGSTTPAEGGPYWEGLNQAVSISANPAAGYTFDHWTVSTGAGAAIPTAASTTVIMDVAKTVTAVFAPTPPQFRGVWVDGFHVGLNSTAEVDDLISRALAGRYNAIMAEVMAYQDGSGSHGARWDSKIVPRADNSFDALDYLIRQAHAVGIEVHAWMVAFRIGTAWPPVNNPTLLAHPEWTMVPQASMGSVVPVGSDYVLDPGSPDAQEYLISIVREIASKYSVDGIHWDYIRYTQTDAGYPSDTSYSRSGLARFKQIAGYTGTPPPTGEPTWDDFRRREVSELIRRVRAELPTLSSAKHSASLIPWGDAPSDWAQSSAYKSCYQDWRMWMEQGYLDAACPMLYDREYDASQYQYYRDWVNACIGWRYNRHMYLGQANYMNTMADSITQLQYSYAQGANGTVNYSYYSTVDSNQDGNTENDWSWYAYVGTNLFTSSTPTPAMPWRNPSLATEGILYGKVVDAATNNPLDDATVQIGSQSIRTDGNGYYVATMLTAASGAGTPYNATASKAGFPPATHSGVRVYAGYSTRHDFVLGTFTDCNNNGIPDACDVSCGNPGCDLAGCGQAADCNHNGVPDECDPNPDGDGIPSECDNCPNAYNPNQADRDHDGVGDACDLCPNTLPGLPVDANGCSAPIPGDFDRDGDVDADDFDAFALCLSGSNVTIADPSCQSKDIDGDGDVDLADYGLMQRCYSGAGVPANPACGG